MLSKAEIQINEEFRTYISKYATVELASYTAEDNLTIHITTQCKWQYCIFYLYKNDTLLEQGASYDGDVEVITGDKIILKWFNDDSNGAQTVTGTFNIKFFNKEKKIKTFTINNIWEYVTWYLFGRLPDGTRWDGN